MSDPPSSSTAGSGIVEVKQSALLPFGIRRRIFLLWRQKMRFGALLVPANSSFATISDTSSVHRHNKRPSSSSTASSPASTSLSFSQTTQDHEPFSLVEEDEEEGVELHQVDLLPSAGQEEQKQRRKASIPLRDMGLDANHKNMQQNGYPPSSYHQIHQQNQSTNSKAAMPVSSSVSSIPSASTKQRPRHSLSCPSSASKTALTLSRAQALLAFLLFISLFLAAIVATFLLTKDAIRAELAQSDANGPEMAKLVGRIQNGEEKDGIEFIRHRKPDKSVIVPSQSTARTNESSESMETSSSEEFEEIEGNGHKQTTEEPGAEELRLSGELCPIWYNLSLRVNVPGFGAQIPAERNLSFQGNLLVKVRVDRSTRLIELNALKLQFDLKNLSQYQLSKVNDDGGEGGRPMPKVIGIRVDEPREKVFFDLNGQLELGEQFIFQIPYFGPIASKLSGLYLTSYTTLSGEQKCAAVTQMEPTDARRMIPCFDEPQFKAIYRLSVIHPIGSRAVSNAKELKEGVQTDEEDWIRTDFDETLPMSSYLLALVVSDFEYVEGHTKRGTRFRIWSRQDAINLTSYALQAGIRVLEFYEEYYGIEFPLPKQDMMAFPDFAAGAMENWGLITYREKYLLYSPELYTAQQKMAVASVVSHELAHQWFGNLVTMRWWSDLWLNEGFATLMEYLGTDAISEYQFRMQDYFLVEALDSAFDRDSRATSHPLFFEIRKAEDVSEAFDSITYSKGASVLRMIRAVMGEQAFKKGLNIYLNRFKFRNAEHSDLWDALTEAVPSELLDAEGAPFSVKQFAKHWTEQTGYPVVQMNRISPNQVSLSQQRFRLDHGGGASNSTTSKLIGRDLRHRNQQQQTLNNINGSIGAKKEEENPNPSWDVPIWWSQNGTEQQMKWLRQDCNLTSTNPEDVLVLNTRSQGFYRVQYGAEELERIRQLLLQDHLKLSMASRVRIIDDTFTLAEGGYIPYEAALNLTRYLAAEKEYPPWEMALTGFNTIQNYFEDEPEAEDMRAYIKSIIGKLFEQELSRINEWEIGEEEKHFFDDLLRQRIIQRMCTLRDLHCISAILNIYKQQFVHHCQPSAPGNGTERRWQMASQCSKVPVPFRTLAYCEGVHYGTEEDWDLVLVMFRRETVQVEKERLLVALACSRDTYTLKKLLAMARDVNSTVIRLQDKPSVFTHVGSRIIGKKIILDFFIDHWEQIYEDFKDQQTLLRSIISSSIVGKSQRVIDQVQQFLRDNQRTTRNLDVFKQRLEVLQTNMRWMQRNFAKLFQWFRDHNVERQQPVSFEEMELSGPLPSPIARRKKSANTIN